jgi:hypothetical protein
VSPSSYSGQFAKSGTPERAEQRISGRARLQPTPNGPSPPRLEYVSASSGANPPGPGGTAIGIFIAAAPVDSETICSAGFGSPGVSIARAARGGENETAIEIHAIASRLP